MNNQTPQPTRGGTTGNRNHVSVSHGDSNRQDQTRHNQGYRSNMSGRGGNHRGYRGPRNYRNQTTASFKGETEGLNGNVFQTQTESKDPTQYKRTVEALERYCDKVYDVDMRSLFGPNPTIPSVSRPKQPEPDGDQVELDAYREEIKQFVKDRKAMERALRALFSVIWGQCSLNVITKLSSLDELEQWKETGACDELLMAVQQILMEFEHKKCVYVTLFKQLRYFYLNRQRDSQNLHRYFETFQVMTESIERYGGTFGDHDAYVREVMEQDGLDFNDDSMEESVREKYFEKARKKFLAIAFLLGGKPDLYENLVVDLENDYLKGNDFFPSTVTEAYQLMANYSQKKELGAPRNNRRHNGIGFLQTSNKKLVKGTDGRIHDSIQCYKCGDTGHYSDKCPKSTSLLQCTPAESDPQDVAPDSTDGNAQDARLGFGFLQVSYAMFQANDQRYQGLNKNWVLLDTQSNCDIFRNKGLLENVRPSDGPGLTLHSNGGEMNANEVGDVIGYGTVWYSPHSLANILSFANVRRKFRVCVDTGPGDPHPTITVYRSNGMPMLFKEHKMGLYVHNSTSESNVVSNVNLKNLYDYTFVTTVAQLESEFSRSDVKRAKNAKLLHRRLGHPAMKKFYSLITNNNIQNCEVNLRDAQLFDYIYGPNSANIKGKTTRTKPDAIAPHVSIPLPATIASFHCQVTLHIDIMFVLGMAFFHTISDHFEFRTVEELSNRKYMSILSCYQNVENVYAARGLTIAHVRGDSEFSSLSSSILPAVFHVAAKGEHVPKIERSIRAVKEQARTIIYGLPYSTYPPIMVRSLLMMSTRLLNLFPTATSMHNMSPLTLVTGRPSPSTKEMTIEFGAYAEVHNANHVTNTMQERTTGAIALQPANATGGWHFMSLATGDKIIRYRWTECHITDSIISSVHNIAAKANKTNSPLNHISNEFASDVHVEGAQEQSHNQHEANNIGDEVNNDDEASNNDQQIEEQNNDDQNNADDNVNHDEQNDALITDDEESTFDSAEVTKNDPPEKEEPNETIFDQLFDVNINNEEDKTEEEAAASKHKEDETEDASEPTLECDETSEENRSVQEEETMTRSESEPSEENRSDEALNEESESRSVNQDECGSGINKKNLQREINRYNLRKRVKKTKDHQFNNQHFNYLNFVTSTRGKNRRISKIESKLYEQKAKEEMSRLRRKQSFNRSKLHSNLVGMCMTQMSAQKGIKVYGKKALTAMAKEYSQLDDLSVFKPRYRKDLSASQISSTLNVIDLIKEKRCGRIKGRTVVDGRGQRGKYEKNETSSSALTLEAFITTLAIEAAELRDVATADIAGAFLKAEQPDLVTIKMRGPAVEAILEANKDKYEKYVTIEQGKKVIYMELMKAMYGTLTAPILWYQLFASTIVDLGFVINPYDPCVANKQIDGKQFTVCWYVDDLKLSHESSEVVTKMIEVIESKFGKMTVTRGTSHTYLGIDFEIKKKRVHINMKQYLQECIDSYGESIMSNATTPSTKQLMEINDESSVLEDFRKDKFHHIVAKLLHISKRARLDLQVSIGFLCTRVQRPTVDDWKKLRRVLQYIRGTIDMERIVSMKLLGEFDIFIDASHGAHWDKKGQTGGCVSVGSGVIHARSNKQNINTKSSTETELVGNSDYLTYPIWIIRFLEAQGCRISKKTLHQDNESTIKLLKNGTKSCGKQSRHVDIRYFWTTDRIKEMGINVLHCATEKMLGDFFTKPLQGTLFRNMRDVVQGLKEYTILKTKEEMCKEVNENDKHDKQNINAVKDKSPCRQERVEELIREKEKKVRFDGCVDLNEKLKLTRNEQKGRTYADTVKMNSLKDIKCVRKYVLK